MVGCGGHHGGNAVPGLGGVDSSVMSVTASQAQVVGDNQTLMQCMQRMGGEDNHGSHTVPGEDGVDTSVMPGKGSQAQVMGGQPESHAVLVEEGGGGEGHRDGHAVPGQGGVDFQCCLGQKAMNR